MADGGIGDDDTSSIVLSCLLNGALLVLFLVVFEVWRDIWDAEKLAPDGAVAVRFCELGLKFSLCGSLLDAALLPLYASGHAQQDGFNRLSLANLQRGSWRIWGVILGAYAMTGIFLMLLRIEWCHFLELRRTNFLRTALGERGRRAEQVQRTIMVSHIPEARQNAEAVFEYFAQMFGRDNVSSCSFFTGSAHSVYPHQEGAATFQSFFGESAPPSLPAASSRQSTLGLPVPPIAGEVIADMVGDVAKQVGHVAEVSGALLHIPSTCTTAFVTLNSAVHWAEAPQVVFTYADDWHITPAPDPQDLLWNNIAVPLRQINVRHRVAVGLCAFGLLFWSIPVSAIQAWANIENFKWRGLARFQETMPVLYSIVVSYLPVLALIILYSLLPYLFEFMAAKYERHKSKSEVQRIVLNRCFAYQLASLYVTVLSGSVWKSFQEILDKPANVLGLLSGSLPNVAVYFVTFILARVGYSLPLLLLRPWDLLQPSPLQVAMPVRCAMGSELSSIALVLVIGLTYSYIAPAIFLACALYFAAATLAYRWLFVYVYEPEFDSGGEFWYDLFAVVLLGLFLGTLSLVALTTAYANNTQFVILLPLPLIVVWFGRHCWKSYGLRSRWMPREDAKAVDEGRGEGAGAEHHDLYRPPERPG